MIGVDGDPSSLPRWSLEDLNALALAEPRDPHLREHQEFLHHTFNTHFAVRSGLDGDALADAGWGLVVAERTSSDVVEALAPLIASRRREAGGERLRTLIYRSGESPAAFLGRHGQGPGPVEPEKVPYYLLLLGPPTDIPFDVQQCLGVKYAVGRLDFETADGYRKYAENVLRCEDRGLRLRRRVALFGPRHDAVTTRSHAFLSSLQRRLEAVGGWCVESFLEERADRQNLLGLLAGEAPPAFLLSVCHGKGLPPGHPDQRGLQGAQLCQPSTDQPRRADTLEAQDLGDVEGGTPGQIFFMNGCFSAGTPRHNSYRHRGEADVCAEEAFTSRLAQKLLAHRAGPVAVIGHVDRTWNYTFEWPEVGTQTSVFESASRALMTGQRVGQAVEESFGHRFAELSVLFSNWQEECRYGRPPGLTLSQLWTARNDAKSVIILGDPAVRLAVDFYD